MITGVYRFAELNVRVESIHGLVQQMCAEYRAEGTADIAVRIAQGDIDAERKRAARTDMQEGRSPGPYTDAYLETLAVYRKIAEGLPEFGGFVFHGSAVAVDNLGYIFTAKSGTGKSTHTRLWRELLGSRAVMINDDKPIIRVKEGRAYVYGSPWDGKERLSSNTRVPVRAVCVLERGKENAILEITRAEALPTLIQQAYRPREGAALKKTLFLLDQWDAAFYRLRCNMDLSAAELSYGIMSGQTEGKA